MNSEMEDVEGPARNARFYLGQVSGAAAATILALLYALFGNLGAGWLWFLGLTVVFAAVWLAEASSLNRIYERNRRRFETNREPNVTDEG